LLIEFPARLLTMSEDNTRRTGRGMLTLAWIGGLGLATYFFSGALERRENPNQRVDSSITSGVAEVRLTRNPYGHYVATGRINAVEVQLMLDTGATAVAIPGAMAADLGLERGREIIVDTANGRAMAYLTTLREVRLGDIVMRDVAATITPGMEGNEVLLGMSFLKHLELVQRGRELTLRQLPR
jgi:aspartyl protease family protein